jgi:hypothetical protein
MGRRRLRSRRTCTHELWSLRDRETNFPFKILDGVLVNTYTYDTFTLPSWDTLVLLQSDGVLDCAS